ncbi:MAG: sulfotransferase [Thermoleophilia bacterium]|nr:sulfotransferase [Thermoleophilia bacterium]
MTADTTDTGAPTAAEPTRDAGGAVVASRAPFFIVGSDRSGTTMLRLILDRASAGPAVPPETMFITDFLPALRSGKLGDHAAAADFTKRVWNHPRVQLWELEGEPQTPPEGLSHEDAFRWGIEQPFIAYMLRHGKTWWADKTPPHIDHIEYLLEIFPDAKFVELVRDGRDVALSIMGLPFGGNNPYATGKRWASCVRKGAEARAEMPDRVVLVRYEDLVTQPEPEVRRVSEFLGIPYEDDMLHVEKTDITKLQKDQQQWFSNLWAGINQTAMGKWRTKMSEHDQRLYLAAAGDELALHGYDLGGLEPLDVNPAYAAALATTNFGTRLVNLVKLRIVKEHGRELGWVIKRRLRRN